ncbi:hypothetical protein ACTAQI_07550 [Pseudarthrobacter sp. alpha12b]
MEFLLPLLGGALGAALINGIIALYKLNRDKSDEHDKWLRDNKQEAYARFISAVVEASLTLGPDDKALAAQQKAAVALSEIRLIGPANVRDAALVLTRLSGTMFRLASERRQMMPEFDANKSKIEEADMKMSAAIAELPDLTEAFVSAARLDIKTEAKDR